MNNAQNTVMSGVGSKNKDSIANNETFSKGKTLHSLFIESAENNPDQVAIASDDRVLTYGNCLTESYRVASALSRYPEKLDKPVALLMEKGWEQPVAALGIMMSGAAYIPIDPSLPDSRIYQILEAAEVKTVVVKHRGDVGSDLNVSHNLNIVSVDDTSEENLFEKEWAMDVSDEDLAYVIFTSGSTGTPKGVAIDHRGAVNTILDVNNRFEVGSKDSVLSISSLSFDLSVYDIFGMFAAGGKVVIPSSENSYNVDSWVDYIENENITIWNTVPTLIQLLIDLLEEEGSSRNLKSLKLCMMSGDWIPVSLPDRIRNFVSNSCRLVSLGGATEASIWSVYYPIEESTKGWRRIPYGRPLSNQSCYVLDKDMNPLGSGVTGDLYIGGLGLAKGYWNDRKRTEESFKRLPDGTLLYRTGDKARYRDDGVLEFLGREDNQVKVQGFRIELGDIESSINTFSGVKTSVVIANGEAHNRRLIGYVEWLDKHKSEGYSNSMQGKLIGNQRSKFILEQHGTKNIPDDVIRYFLLESDNTLSENKIKTKLLNTLSYLKQYPQGEKPLPKYAYPSASSLYPVQLYVSLASGIGDLPRGNYYYSPKEDALVPFEAELGYEQSSIKSDIVVHMVANMSAIFPMYKESLSRKLVALEAGYLLKAMKLSAAKNGLNISERWNESDYPKKLFPNDNNEYLPLGACDITLDKSKGISSIQIEENDLYYRQSMRTFVQQVPDIKIINDMVSGIYHPEELDIYIFRKGNDDSQNSDIEIFKLDPKANKVSYLKKLQSIKTAFQGANGTIYDKSTFGVLLTASQTGTTPKIKLLAEAGSWGQSVMSNCWRMSIGVCPIGWVDSDLLINMDVIEPGTEVVHSFLGGIVTVDQFKNSQDKILDTHGGEDTINELKRYLNSKLPHYMVPSLIYSVDRMPLTTTGKVDRKSFPLNIEKTEVIKGEEKSEQEDERPIVSLWKEILGVDSIAESDSFFSLGGNSLGAMKMLAVLKKEHGIDINLRNFFENPTISAVCGNYDNVNKENDKDLFFALREKYDRDNRPVRITDMDRSTYDFYPSSLAQQYMLSGEFKSDSQSSYNILLAIDIRKSITAAELKRAIRPIAQKHNALRTKLCYAEGALLQCVRRSSSIDIFYNDISALSESESQKQLNNLIEKEAAKPFTLINGDLVRYTLIKTDDQHYVFLFNIHHLVADFHSVVILEQEIIESLSGDRLENNEQSIEDSVQYTDFCIWQKEFLYKDESKDQVKYWKAQLNNMPTLNIPDARVNTTVGDVGKWKHSTIDNKTLIELIERGKKEDVTTFMIGAAALYLAVSSICGQDDVCIGTPISTRTEPGLDDVVGLMLNTVVLRIHPAPEMSASEFLEHVKGVCLNAFSNCQVPYEKVVGEISDDNQPMRGSYGVRYVYRNVSGIKRSRDNSIATRSMDMDRSDAKFDLLVSLNEHENGLDNTFEYKSKLWRDMTVSEMQVVYEEALQWLSNSFHDSSIEDFRNDVDSVLNNNRNDRLNASKKKKMNELESLIQ